MKRFNSYFKKETESHDENCTTVVWIHGANQSSLSFEYLRQQCNFKKEYLINYSSSNKFYDNLNQMIQELGEFEKIFTIGHSMGGLYSIHLTQKLPVIGGVSISTPFEGSYVADWARYLAPSYQLFKDVGRRSQPVNEAQKIKLEIPWTQVVSTSGSVPYIGSKNDGVVTIQSMTNRTDVEYVHVGHNHYEVMCSSQVADIVKSKYQLAT
jgi:pimeloyl-ACP methyl ester carboxylesterase